MTINIEESGWVVNGLHGGPSQDDIGQTPPPAVTPNFDMRLVGCGGPQHPILAIGREAHSETSSVGLIWRPREFALIAHRNRAKIPQECGASSRLPSHSLLRCPARSAADIGPRRSVRIAAGNRFEFEKRGLQRFLFFPRLQLSATRGAQALPTVGVTVGDKKMCQAWPAHAASADASAAFGAGMQKINGALRIRRGWEDRALVVFQNFDPACIFFTLNSKLTNFKALNSRITFAVRPYHHPIYFKDGYYGDSARD
jgi:hypothetical protein